MTIRQSGTIQRRTIPRSEPERWPVRRFKFASVSWTLIYDTGPFNVTIRTVAENSLYHASDEPFPYGGIQGKVVLLDFRATWCGGCKVEIPWYVEFQNKYRNYGLRAIGVSMDDDGWKSVRPFLEKHKLNYRVVIGNQDLANRYGGLPFLPMTLLIDRNGTIAESHPGVVDKQAFENKIKALLQESPAR